MTIIVMMNSCDTCYDEHKTIIKCRQCTYKSCKNCTAIWSLKNKFCPMCKVKNPTVNIKQAFMKPKLPIVHNRIFLYNREINELYVKSNSRLIYVKAYGTTGKKILKDHGLTLYKVLNTINFRIDNETWIHNEEPFSINEKDDPDTVYVTKTSK
jgi:hypothetical protein